MDTATAFMMGDMYRGQPMRVFDWEKAAHYIRDNDIQNAEAGLSEDLEWTCGPILADGKIIAKHDTYTYLASTWATPVLIVNGVQHEMWIWQDEAERRYGKDVELARVYLPPESVKILNGES